MTNRKKIILAVVLVMVLILIGELVYFQLFKLCGNCGTPPLNYNNYTLIYSSENGSLPPPYHKEQTLTASKDATGTVKAEYEIRDYEKSLEKGDVSISNDKFDKLVSGALLLGPGKLNSLDGCTGGSSESLKVLEGEKTIIDVFSYNCANQTTNESLAKFSIESGLYDLLPSAS